MNTASTIRVIDDPALDGPTNMARDEALMARVGSGLSPPAVRLYQWDPATISLGYFQPFADYQELPPPAGELPVVRRPTGGGAILHDLELTYSIVVPNTHPLVAGAPNRLYEMAHDAVIAALKTLGVESGRCGLTDGSGPRSGPFFCFARRHCFDVLVGADKIAGSAQRRTRAAVLQHGSIVLGNRFTQQPTAVVSEPFDEAVKRIRRLFLEHLAAVTGAALDLGTWHDEELRLAETFVDKYAGDAWTTRV